MNDSVAKFTIATTAVNRVQCVKMQSAPLNFLVTFRGREKSKGRMGASEKGSRLVARAAERMASTATVVYPCATSSNKQAPTEGLQLNLRQTIWLVSSNEVCPVALIILQSGRGVAAVSSALP